MLRSRNVARQGARKDNSLQMQIMWFKRYQIKGYQVGLSSKKSVDAKTKGGNNINEKIIGLTLQQEF